MNKTSFKLLLISIISLVLSGTISANETIQNISEQLGDNAQKVHTVCEDEYGFIWVGTQNGVIKYDGINHSHFKTVQKDSLALPLNFIRSLHPLSEEYFLIGTDYLGLTVYEYATNKISVVPFPLDSLSVGIEAVLDIEVDRDKNIWLAFYGGVVVLDSAFNYVFEIKDKSGAYSIHQSSWDDIYISFIEKGLYKYNYKTNELEEAYADHTVKRRYSEITETDRQTVIIANDRNELHEVDKNNKHIQTIKLKTHYKQEEFCWLRGLESDNNSIIAGGVNSGVHQVPLDADKDSYYYASISTGDKPASVTDIIKDQLGNFWVGTGDRGLVKINRNAYFSSSFSGEPAEWLGKAIVNCFYELDSVLWIGTDGRGLLYYDKKSSTFGSITQDDGLPNGIITDIVEGRNGELWLSSWDGGVIQFNTKTNAIKVYSYRAGDTAALNNSRVKDLAFINDTLWITTTGDGVNLLIPETGQIISKNNNKQYPYDLGAPRWGNMILEDSFGAKWIATELGLYSFHHGKTNVFFASGDTLCKIYDDHIVDLYEDDKQRLWIASNLGLQYFNKERTKIVQISNKVIPQGVVSIIPQSDSVLFCATSFGIYQLNINTLQTELFLKEDGLPNNSFRQRSAFKGDDGTFYFGSYKGMGFCIPDLIREKRSDLNVFVSSILVYEAGNNLTNSYFNLFNDTAIVVDYHHSSIDIQFGVLGVPDMHRIEASYKIDGLDEEYKSTQDLSIALARLNAGNYTVSIVVKYNGIKEVRKIHINVITPFWQTAWFKAVIILLIAGFLFFIYKYRIQVLKNHRFEQLVNEKTAELQLKNKALLIKGEELGKAYDELEVTYAELKGQSEELEALNIELQNANKTQNDITSILTHDVKNNFSVVTGFTSLLFKSKNNVDKFLPHIVKGVENSSMILENLLDWGRSQGDNIVLSPETINLTELLKDVISQNVVLAEMKQIDITNNLNQSFYITGDRHTLMLIFRNLIHNAIKFSEHDSEIIIDATADSGKIAVSVQDFGIGIKPEKLNGLFEGDVVTSEFGSKGEIGTGLGLKLCKKFTEMNNGVVSVKSKAFAGTEFAVCFPLVEEKPIDSKEKPKTSKELEQPLMKSALVVEKQKDIKVLIAEDDSSLREELKIKLSKYFTVKVVKNGKEALESINEHMPDIVVTDYMMPKMKGDELCKTIKSDEATVHIPVLILTAMTSEEFEMKCWEAGADGYFTKSGDFDRVLLKISTIIKTRQKLFKKTETQAEDSKSKEGSQFIDELQQIIKENFDDPMFGVESLADIVGFTRSHLYRKTKMYSKMTPIEFITEYRLKKAKDLLATKEYSVGQVAHLAGFNAPEYFSRKFKAKYGVRPSEYKG